MLGLIVVVAWNYSGNGRYAFYEEPDRRIVLDTRTGKVFLITSTNLIEVDPQSGSVALRTASLVDK